MEGERKIGEVFEYNGVKLIVRKMSSWGDCRRCFFGKKGNITSKSRPHIGSLIANLQTGEAIRNQKRLK